MNNHSFQPGDLALLLLPESDPYYKQSRNRPVRLIRTLDRRDSTFRGRYDTPQWLFLFVDGETLSGAATPHMSIAANYLEPYCLYPAPASLTQKGLPEL